MLKVLLIFSIFFNFGLLAKDKSRTLKVGVTEDFPPFYFKDNGKYQGATIEIVQEVFKRLNYKLKFEVAPMARLLNALETGRYHISPNLTATEKRRMVAVFSEVPIVFESQDLIVKANSKIKFDGNLHAMKKYSFGAMTGWTHGPNFDSADYLEKQFRATVEQQIKSLIAGRFKVAVNNKDFFLNRARDLGVEKSIKVLSPSTYLLPVTIAVSKALKNREEIIVNFDRELIKFKKEKKYRNILKKYKLKLLE